MSHISVQFLTIPPTPSSLPKAKRDSLFLSQLSSGRGGSGNFRRSYVSATGEPSPDVLSPREPVSGSTTNNKASSIFRVENGKQLQSIGRGGSGNIQPPATVMPDVLEAHPQTAAILSFHTAMVKQSEQLVRQVHNESKVVRSSGRGGSGNISHTRQRSRLQTSSVAPKMRLFRKKSVERGSMRDCESVNQARDKDGMMKADKRASRATRSSSGSSSPLDAACGNSEGKRGSFDSRMVAKSRSSVQSDLLSAGTSEDAQIAELTRKRDSFLSRYSTESNKHLRASTASLTTIRTTTTPPTSPLPTSPSKTTGSPRGSRSGGLSPVSHLKACSTSWVVLEDQEYFSFLDFGDE